MSLTSEKARASTFNQLNLQTCEFCGRVCKNINSFKQHTIRCKNNPNRKSYNNLGNYSHNTRKGQTKETNPDIAKCALALKQKYANEPSPNTGRKVEFQYLYEEHNNEEIQKWRDYVSSVKVDIPVYKTLSHGKGENTYNIIQKMYNKVGNSIRYVFEHDFIVNIYLHGNLLPQNTVHHIDKNPKNNNIDNLLVFDTLTEHKRFHNSKYAWLIYNDDTHKFNCVLKSID